MRALMQVVVCVLLMTPCFVTASFFQNRVESHRDRIRGDTVFGTGVKDAQVILLTHVLGGFKGLLIDAVWLRAERLQSEQRYWELYQLYNWMGKLQPNLVRIWTFNAWNMSYNIVAQQDHPEARWRWISRALDYLRRDALKYNPKSGKIMNEIARILYQKIGQDIDYYAKGYRYRFAVEMSEIMGPPDLHDFKTLIAAPQDLSTLLKDKDVARALRDFTLDPEVPPISELDRGDGFRFIPDSIMVALFRDEPKVMPHEEFLRTPEGKAAHKVINYVIAKALRDKLCIKHLEHAYAIEQEFGSFDWRLPEPHAIYWANLGIGVDTKNAQVLNNRYALASLKQSMRRGKIIYIDKGGNGTITTTSDLSKIEPLDKLYRSLISKIPVDLDHPEAMAMRDAHSDMLKLAGEMLYFHGEEQKATKYFNARKDLYDKPSKDTTLADYYIGLTKQKIDESASLAEAEAIVRGMLMQGLLALVQNDAEAALRFENVSKEAWKVTREHHNAIVTIVGKGGETLLDWKDYHREVVRGIVTRQIYFPPKFIPRLIDRLNIPASVFEGDGKRHPSEGREIPPLPRPPK